MLNRRKAQTALYTWRRILAKLILFSWRGWTCIVSVFVFCLTNFRFLQWLLLTGGNTYVCIPITLKLYLRYIRQLSLSLYNCFLYVVRTVFRVVSSSKKQGNFSAVLLEPTINNVHFTVFLYFHTYCLSYNIIVEYNKWISVWETIRFLV